MYSDVVGIELEWALNGPFLGYTVSFQWLPSLLVRLLLCALTRAFSVTVVGCADDAMS